jgi:hypothetical protein
MRRRCVRRARVTNGGKNVSGNQASKQELPDNPAEWKRIMINSKLAKFANKEIRISPTGRRGGNNRIEALVAVTKTTEGVKRHSIRISLHPRAVQSLGWILGDRINFAITDEGGFVMFRDAKGTMLCGQSTNKSKRSYVRASVTEEFFNAVDKAEGKEVEIEGGRIAFMI